MSEKIEPLRLHAARAQLLVIDVQARLMPHIADGPARDRRAALMIRAAQILELPSTCTEQYPAGLGPTCGEVAAALNAQTARFEKTSFSVMGDPRAAAHVRGLRRSDVLVVGVETHVCVLQTALDLLAAGLQAFVLTDAVGSRRPGDYETALRRMQQAGVVLSTVESAIYELMEKSGTDLFRRMLPLLKEDAR
ncbi:MAG: hypothetical protein CHACPFDD_03741 [Phycisphaerae bacterium]|nr:hypothetical protein [Phycisphaerae bacterium]